MNRRSNAERRARPRARPGTGLAVTAALTLSLASSACGGEGSGARSGASDSLRGRGLPEPLPKPAATLTNTRGEPYALRTETEGRVTLLFFGYTHCPDVCPVHLANLGAALDRLGREVADRIAVVFVTTDPDRDTPERIRSWLDRFDRDFVGLRGHPDTVAAMERALGLPPAVRRDREGGDYVVGHAAQVVAFTADGMARVVYPFGTRQADWVHDLPRLVAWGAGGAKPPAEVIPGPAAPEPGLAGRVFRAGSIAVSRVRVAESLDSDRSALWFTIENGGDADEALVAMETEAAERIELHAGHAGRMPSPGGLPVPAGTRVALEPGELHGMLLGLHRPLAPGDVVPVTLRFREAGIVPVLAVVRGYDQLGAASPHTGRE